MSKKPNPDDGKPGPGENELGQEIQTATVSGHNVGTGVVGGISGTRSSIGIRPEDQPETGNVRSQIPAIEEKDRKAREELHLDPLEIKHKREVEELNERHAKERNALFEKEERRLHGEKQPQKAEQPKKD